MIKSSLLFRKIAKGSVCKCAFSGRGNIKKAPLEVQKELYGEIEVSVFRKRKYGAEFLSHV